MAVEYKEVLYSPCGYCTVRPVDRVYHETLGICNVRRGIYSNLNMLAFKKLKNERVPQICHLPEFRPKIFSTGPNIVCSVSFVG